MFLANGIFNFSYTRGIARGGAFMRHFRYFPLLLVTALLLTSCNIYQVLPRADLNISVVGGGGTSGGATLSDIMIGVKIEEDEQTGARTVTYIIPEIALTASARPGSIGANLSAYSIDYFNPSGSRIETASSTTRGTLNINVTPGVQCPSGTVNCTLNSKDSYYAQGTPATSTSFSALDGDILNALLALPDSDGSYAVISVSGVDTNGNEYTKTLEPVRIIFRVVE
jgi:hypothetical protein